MAEKKPTIPNQSPRPTRDQTAWIPQRPADQTGRVEKGGAVYDQATPPPPPPRGKDQSK